MLATPPFWASSNMALMRASNKPPLEVVVADLDHSSRAADSQLRISYQIDRNGVCNRSRQWICISDSINCLYNLFLNVRFTSHIQHHLLLFLSRLSSDPAILKNFFILYLASFVFWMYINQTSATC